MIFEGEKQGIVFPGSPPPFLPSWLYLVMVGVGSGVVGGMSGSSSTVVYFRR